MGTFMKGRESSSPKVLLRLHPQPDRQGPGGEGVSELREDTQEGWPSACWTPTVTMKASSFI
jgi:hypothetical protein